MSFLRQILKGEKKILKQSQINHIPIPRYKEISVKRLFDFAMQDEEVRAYLPESKDVSKI
jgi:hypothetical protein